MRTLRFLFCAVCLCSVGAFAKTALTQEKDADRFSRPAESISDENLAVQDAQLDRSFDRERATKFSDLDLPARPRTNEPTMDRMRPRTVRRTVEQTIYEPIPPEELKAYFELQTAIKQLSTGKDDEARKAAVDTIQQQLTTQFEADLKQRETELQEVEQRVKSLREQLDKRKAAQADIINLRLQTLVNNANGLGFPDASFGSSEVNFLPREYALPNNAPLYQPGKSDPDLSVPLNPPPVDEARPSRR